MISRDILPAPELRDMIYRYRLRHFKFDGSIIPPPKPFPPRPEQCLIFYPRGHEQIEHPLTRQKTGRSRSVITGQFTERVNRLIGSEEFLMIAVEFKPGALYRLTGINLSEITNTSIDAEAIFGLELPGVNNRLSGAESYEEMISIIELFLQKIKSQSSRELIAADDVLNNLVSSGDILSVDKLSKKCYLSPRHLERKLNERIGICPKTFLRLSRFNRSLNMRLANPGMTWMSVAIESGYNDYQHLSKEYKTYTNNTPNLFLSEEYQSPGRILGLTR